MVNKKEVKQQKLAINHQFASNIIWTNLSKYGILDQHIVSKYFDNIPSHWLPLLMPFETETPQKFYTEAIFEITSSILSKAFDNNINYFENCLTYFANEIDSAYAGYKRITQSIRDLPTKEFDRELQFRQFVFPIYQELIEAVWRPLSRFFVIALEEPLEKYFGKYSTFTINDIESKLTSKKHQQFQLIDGFDRELRNNIAHYKFEFSDDVMKQDMVILHDPIERDITDNEIDILLENLYDNCSAMLYSLLRFGALNERNLKVIPFGHFIRSKIVTQAIENKHIFIEQNTFSGEKGNRQRNLKIIYDYPCDTRAVMFVFSVLKLAVKFLPSDRYYIVVGPPKGKLYIWILTENKTALSFVENKLGLSDYLKTGDIQILRDKDNLFRLPRFPLKLRILPNLFTISVHTFKREIRYIKGWSILHEYNFSTGISGRFEIFIVQYRELSQEEIRRIIKKVVGKQRAILKHLLIALWHLFLSLFKKKIRVLPPINVVLISLWQKEKRISQLSLNPQLGANSCICCAEWNRDKDFQWLKPSDKDESLNNIVIRWFNK